MNTVPYTKYTLVIHPSTVLLTIQERPTKTDLVLNPISKKNRTPCQMSHPPIDHTT